MADVYADAEWEKVNGMTARMEVPGGWLYRVLPGGGHPPLLSFVADPPLGRDIYKLGEALGNGNAATPFGAIEGHAVMVKEASQRIAESIDGLAAALRERDA